MDNIFVLVLECIVYTHSCSLELQRQRGRKLQQHKYEQCGDDIESCQARADRLKTMFAHSSVDRCHIKKMHGGKRKFFANSSFLIFRTANRNGKALQISKVQLMRHDTGVRETKLTLPIARQ
jgi:hypothetical protein